MISCRRFVGLSVSIILVLLQGPFRGSIVRADDYVIGADLSSLADAEKNGPVFKDDGQLKPGLAIFQAHGYNWIRLRLFHSPDRLPNDLTYTIALAKAAKQQGYKFLLDFHYSDTWADPQKQFTPKAWEALSHDQLADAVVHLLAIHSRPSGMPTPCPIWFKSAMK